MRIQPIQHGNVYQCSANKNQKGNPQFGKLRLAGGGAWMIASELGKRPELEKAFFERVLTPLKKCATDVIYDGNSILLRKPKDKSYSSLLMAYPGAYTIYSTWREVFPGHDRPENMEEDFLRSGCYELGCLQAAKNIACHWDKEGKNPHPEKEIAPLWDLSKMKIDLRQSTESIARAKNFYDKAKKVEDFVKD